MGLGARVILFIWAVDAWFMKRNYYLRAFALISAMAGMFILGMFSMFQWMGYYIRGMYLDEISVVRIFVLLIWMLGSAVLLMFGAVGTLKLIMVFLRQEIKSWKAEAELLEKDGENI